MLKLAEVAQQKSKQPLQQVTEQLTKQEVEVVATEAAAAAMVAHFAAEKLATQASEHLARIKEVWKF